MAHKQIDSTTAEDTSRKRKRSNHAESIVASTQSTSWLQNRLMRLFVEFRRITAIVTVHYSSLMLKSIFLEVETSIPGMATMVFHVLLTRYENRYLSTEYIDIEKIQFFGDLGSMHHQVSERNTEPESNILLIQMIMSYLESSKEFTKREHYTHLISGSII